MNSNFKNEIQTFGRSLLPIAVLAPVGMLMGICSALGQAYMIDKLPYFMKCLLQDDSIFGWPHQQHRVPEHPTVVRHGGCLWHVEERKRDCGILFRDCLFDIADLNARAPQINGAIGHREYGFCRAGDGAWYTHSEN